MIYNTCLQYKDIIFININVFVKSPRSENSSPPKNVDVSYLLSPVI